MSPRRSALHAVALLVASAAAQSAAAQTPAKLPDWSGQWENVGATPSPDGGFYEPLDQVLKELEWSPPSKPEVQAAVDKIAAAQRKAMDAMRKGIDPGGAVTACSFGYPALMITDTAPFRYRYYHTAQDLPDKMDFERMSRVVEGLETVVQKLGGARR